MERNCKKDFLYRILNLYWKQTFDLNQTKSEIENLRDSNLILNDELLKKISIEKTNDLLIAEYKNLLDSKEKESEMLKKSIEKLNSDLKLKDVTHNLLIADLNNTFNLVETELEELKKINSKHYLDKKLYEKDFNILQSQLDELVSDKLNMELNKNTLIEDLNKKLQEKEIELKDWMESKEALLAEKLLKDNINESMAFDASLLVSELEIRRSYIKEMEKNIEEKELKIASLESNLENEKFQRLQLNSQKETEIKTLETNIEELKMLHNETIKKLTEKLAEKTNEINDLFKSELLLIKNLNDRDQQTVDMIAIIKKYESELEHYKRIIEK